MTNKPLIPLLLALLLLGGAALLWQRAARPDTTPPKLRNSETPKPRNSETPLHPAVAALLDQASSAPYLKLNFLVKKIPRNLAARDIDALIAFIRGPAPARLPSLQWASIANDVEEILTIQTRPSPAVARALLSIHRDPSASPVMRDYALQHIGGMAIFLVHTTPPPKLQNTETPPHRPTETPPHRPTETPPHRNTETPTHRNTETPLLPLLLAELQSAAADPASPRAGTALNLLDGLLRAAEYRRTSLPGLDPATLARTAFRAASDPSAPLNLRLPALQIAARRNAPGAPGLARSILADPASGLMLRQSAAAVLARLGCSGDLPALRRLASRAGPHLAPAAQSAIRSIESRIQRQDTRYKIQDAKSGREE